MSEIVGVQLTHHQVAMDGAGALLIHGVDHDASLFRGAGGDAVDGGVGHGFVPFVCLFIIKDQGAD